MNSDAFHFRWYNIKEFNVKSPNAIFQLSKLKLTIFIQHAIFIRCWWFGRIDLGYISSHSSWSIRRRSFLHGCTGNHEFLTKVFIQLTFLGDLKAKYCGKSLVWFKMFQNVSKLLPIIIHDYVWIFSVV